MLGYGIENKHQTEEISYKRLKIYSRYCRQWNKLLRRKHRRTNKLKLMSYKMDNKITTINIRDALESRDPTEILRRVKEIKSILAYEDNNLNAIIEELEVIETRIKIDSGDYAYFISSTLSFLLKDIEEWIVFNGYTII